MTFGNVDLHLILGRPCVHPDDDLIVGHIALVVADMPALKERLAKMGIPYLHGKTFLCQILMMTI